MKDIKEMTDYAWAKRQADAWNIGLKEVKLEHKLSNEKVLAMSTGNDPYWMTPADFIRAKWAEKVMEALIKPHIERIGVKDIHLRDIHYTLTSGGSDQKAWNGEVYQNTEKCWSELISAFAVARYTGVVDWELIRDNKNVFYHHTNYTKNKNFGERINDGVADLTVDNLIYETILYRFTDMLNHWNWMPTHVEVWAEKDLALLDMICEENKVNLVVGEGETSITQVFLLAQRIVNIGKPARICYVSDCDVVGTNMVKAMSRKLEFILKSLLHDDSFDVKVIPLMLTPTQVCDYDLPTIPMKPSKSNAYETRKDNWLYSRKLDGAVEVNSFHALYPDDFRSVLEAFIFRYKDIELWNKIEAFNIGIQDFVKEQIDHNLIDINSIIKAVEDVDWDKVTEEYDEDIKNLGKSELDYKNNDEEYAWLLDTKKNYFEQLRKYNLYDNGTLKKEWKEK